MWVASSSEVAVTESRSGFCCAGGVLSGVAVTHVHQGGGRSLRGRVSQPALAKVTLGNERVSLSTGGILWGHGPTAMNLIDQIRMKGGVSDAVLRRRVVDVWIEHQILELIRMRTLVARLRGEQPGPEASIRKILADEHGQHVAALAVDMMGANGVLGSNVDIDHAVWTGAFLFSQALTVGGGTGNVQRNIVAERVLQLPHEPGLN